MPSFKVYDPDQVTVSFAGQNITGWADGEFVRIEQETDNFSDVVGTDGEVVRSKTNDRRATITFLLMQTSDSNDVLSALANNDLANSGGEEVNPFVVKDLQGRAIFQAENAWISKPPDVSFDREATAREWTLRCDSIVRLDGGN
jgi:hypothetical protein